MKEAIGSVPLYSIIITFIVITFGFLSATLTYYKAFKLNSRVAYILEKYEGYNSLSANDINNDLGSMGYRRQSNKECPSKKNMALKTNLNSSYSICIYESKKKNGYFNYGIVTYIYLDIPIIGSSFRLPVYTESERIFKFNG